MYYTRQENRKKRKYRQFTPHYIKHILEAVFGRFSENFFIFFLRQNRTSPKRKDIATKAAMPNAKKIVVRSPPINTKRPSKT